MIFQNRFFGEMEMIRAKNRLASANYRPSNLPFPKSDATLLHYEMGSKTVKCEPISINLQVPVLNPYKVDIEFIKSQTSFLDFDKCMKAAKTDVIVHFYLHDYRFIRFLNNPDKYLPKLRQFRYVISPDFSQYLYMPTFQRLCQSFWNCWTAAVMQQEGVNIIYNVAWSLPDSYQYVYGNVPINSVIAINSTGISSPTELYLWRRGYEAALRIIDPQFILRYGPQMPGEHTEISHFVENIHIKNARNGSKRNRSRRAS